MSSDWSYFSNTELRIHPSKTWQRCCYKQDSLRGHSPGIPHKDTLGIVSISQKHFISESTPTCLNSVRDPDFKISRVNILDCWPKCGCSPWAHAFLWELVFVRLILLQDNWSGKKSLRATCYIPYIGLQDFKILWIASEPLVGQGIVTTSRTQVYLSSTIWSRLHHYQWND